MNLVIFQPQYIASGYLVSATPHTILYQSFWNFAHVFSIVWRCACALDIILALIFVTFCRTCFSMGDLGVQVSVRPFVHPSVRPSVRPSVNIYPGCLVSATPLTVLYLSFGNFACVFIMVWGCACGLDNCEIIFCHFFHFVYLVIFWPQWIDSGYIVSATLHTILYWSFWNFAHVFSMVWRCAYGLDIILALILLTLFNFAHLFVHGLKMCMWFGFNPAVNFCHFSTLLTLSFFAGATSTSPKFDLY